MIKYFSHGRTALKYGLQYLGLKKGDNILIPEYICDVVIDPINDLKIKPIYYKIKSNFEIELDDIKKKIKKNTKAVLIVNYFGFVESNKKLTNYCKNKKIYLIEDNCHSLSDRNINKSDISFYSPRKIVNKLYSGGVLKINLKKKTSQKILYPSKKYTVNNIEQFKKYLDQNFPYIKKLIKIFFYKKPSYQLINTIKNEKINDDFYIDYKSKKILDKINYSNAEKDRIKNFYHFKKIFEEKKYVKNIERNLKRKTIPWMFPVYVNNFELRNKLFEFGWKHGISIFSWPSLPKKNLNKRTKKIWNKLVCIDTKKIPNDLENFKKILNLN